ncbi:1,4-dihydroxy-2-naphthoate polyprenyltransferase [Pseudalkalibacillus caeni]|uniref:1,4-dihydroxy-2-naphthoate octaprenyltransferase n=1 Tax=Exobacillus caeni TaxID=2574798 RepID=A0A5R9F5I3_9BACL|nr:1,4-dihydroxy-2-naphthoate polyprenyltransferase [Pseudalkalibacillus caeni]TLS39002.1 1,4-dihydroxy-2-naphthoate polyprenyltransferase [Pseudalkalibacillus caeni]
MEERLKNSTHDLGKSSPRVNWQVWWRLLRPHTLTAGFVPVLVGTMLALPYGELDLSVFAAMMVASLLIQSATNMFNEYYDFKRGLDTAESVGIGGAIVREGISARTVLNLAISFFGIAVLLGIYICMNSSWWIGLIGALSMAVGYYYTGGPYPIAYTPFGELAAGLFMGLILILISFFIQSGTVTAESILVSVPVSILVGGILMANNIRDLTGDKEKGRKTLAILLGHKKAVLFLAGMFIVSYLWIIGLVLAGYASSWLLLVFISLPKAMKAYKLFVGKTKAVQMVPAMKATAQMHTIFGFLLSVGLLFNYLF